MGIETNYGTYVGKMDILSSLSTLSFDKRRSEFFTNELLILLKLIDTNQIDYKTFMVLGLEHLVFFNLCHQQLKIMQSILIMIIILILKIHDAYASAGNYLNNMGWKQNSHCFYKIKLNENIPKKYLNVSAKKLNNKKKLKYFKKFIIDYENLDF